MGEQPKGPWTLKAQRAGDLRRVRPWPPVGVDPSCLAAKEAVQKLFELSEEETAALVLKYQDEQGDLCTLTELSLSDALSLADSASGILRLTVELKAVERQPAAAAAPGQPASAREAETPVEELPWGSLQWLSQRVRQEVTTTAAELSTAFSQPDGLRNYSATLQGRLQNRVDEACTAASQASAAASEACGQGQCDAKTGLALAAAVAVPTAVVAMAPGRCMRLGLLAAGALAAAKLGDSLANAAQSEPSSEKQEDSGEARSPTLTEPRQRKPHEHDNEPAETLD